MKSDRQADQRWADDVRAENLRKASRPPSRRRSSDRDPVKVARLVGFVAGACVASAVWAAAVWS